MINLLNLLPEELQTIIYQKYFSRYVLNNIKKKRCFYTYSLGQGRNCFKCNFNTIDSAFCMACHVQRT